MAGRQITAARTQVAGLAPERLVGQTIDAVEARGKHVLIRLSPSGRVVHSHMRMTGSWHVYPAGQRWRRPERQARLVLECGDRVAVCFNAPVVELLAARGELLHPSLSRLGPDVLVSPLDLPEIRTRAKARGDDVPLGELLLDQQVVSGIGNIWRCEALFAERVNPWTARSSITDDRFDALVTAAARLMTRSATGAMAHRPVPQVYQRNGRPCRRCGTRIEARRQGDQARTAFWCPGCQPLA
ncbi:MAG: Formamidopyrimidine-DNA glycosylase [Acidimicrobiales bacterium]|nr:Formamidopyrimidine-DNA glycosylase [Acidimicrobiales bacterium]